MSIITKYYCTDCDSDVEPLSHDCPNSPENISKREEARRRWEERYNEAWHAWNDWLGGRESHAIPSIEFKPDDIAVEGECDFQIGNYVTPKYTNPTWGDIFKEFNLSFYYNDDYDNCILKGIKHIYGDTYRVIRGS